MATASVNHSVTKFIIILLILILSISVLYILFYNKPAVRSRQSLLISAEQQQSIILSKECFNTKCSNRLSHSDALAYEKCSASAKISQPSETDCVFLKDNNRSTITLSSFPGSGNTWVRGLLQKATGYCTGALFCDAYLRKHGFAGEGVLSGSAVLVTKNHYPISTVHNRFDYHITFTKAILLIRDPFKAIIADWNRAKWENKSLMNDTLNSHTAVVGEEYFSKCYL